MGYPNLNPNVPASVGNDINWYSSTFAAYGNTYLTWGTDWIANNFICTSATFTDRIIKFTVEQGAGFTAMVALLNDGKDCELELVDTTQYPQFSIGGNSPFSNPFSIVSPSGIIQVLLEQNKVGYARKREGMRTAMFASYNAFAIGGSSTPI